MVYIKVGGVWLLTDSIQWSIIAGLGTAMGALLIFAKKNWSPASLSFYLGLASGVMIAVVFFDMLPSAILFAGFSKVFIGILLGILLMALSDFVIFKKMSGPQTLTGLGYLIMLGIAMHDLPEGMAIALGDEMKAQTGLIIALGIGIHNIPEGMAIAVPLIMAGISKPRIFLQILAVGIITPLGTMLGQTLVSVLPAWLPILLGLASGIMVYLVIFQLWPQAKVKDRKTRWWGFFLGMLIILVATFI
jgi:ZIP family zinc transporter